MDYVDSIKSLFPEWRIAHGHLEAVHTLDPQDNHQNFRADTHAVLVCVRPVSPVTMHQELSFVSLHLLRHSVGFRIEANKLSQLPLSEDRVTMGKTSSNTSWTRSQQQYP